MPAYAGEGKWTLPHLSVYDEPDFVNEITARVLGLQLELAVCLDQAGVYTTVHWRDARIEGAESIGSSFAGDNNTRATWRMGSQPVGTCAVVGDAELLPDSAPAVPGGGLEQESEQVFVQKPLESVYSSVAFQGGHTGRPAPGALAPDEIKWTSGRSSEPVHASVPVSGRGSAKAGRRVSFSFEVAFWFPAPKQLELHCHNTPHGRSAVAVESAAWLEGGSCRTFATPAPPELCPRQLATPASARSFVRPSGRLPLALSGDAGQSRHVLGPVARDFPRPSLRAPASELQSASEPPPPTSHDGRLLGSPAYVLSTAHDERWQYFAVFDVIQHVRVHRARPEATITGIVTEAIRSAQHLPSPISFRLLQHTVPGLPQVQLVLWSEPNPGFRVMPVIGTASHAVCTVNVPVDCPPFELASQVSLSCGVLDRLRYQVADGSQAVLVDGQPTAPFVPGQLAGGDYCDVSSPLGGTVLWNGEAADLIVPMLLTQERFAQQTTAIAVHRLQAPMAVVEVPAHHGPQQVLIRVLGALGLPGTGRMSCTAISPVEHVCRLHVVVHPGSQRPMQLIPCLVDLRRVAYPPVANWAVVLLPPTCTRADVLAALAEQCPSLLPIAAAFANYVRIGERAVGVNRNTVITLTRDEPVEALDTLAPTGGFMPRVFCGSDIAALRPGFARFLAAPASLTSTTTSTTCTLAVEHNDRPRGLADSRVRGFANFYTAFDAGRQVKLRERPATWDPYQCIVDAVEFSSTPNPRGRWILAQVEGFPGPQVIIVLVCPLCEPTVITCDYPLGTPFRSFLLDLQSTAARSWVEILQSQASFNCLADGMRIAGSQPLAQDVDVVLVFLGCVAEPVELADTLAISGLPLSDVSLTVAGGSASSDQSHVHHPPSQDAASASRQPSAALEAAPCNAASSGPELVAVFDEFHHMRVMAVPHGALPVHVVSLAFAQTPQLALPRGFRFLQRKVPGLPRRQLCIWGGLPAGQVVIPFVMQEPSWPVCTVRIPIEASAFEAALSVEEYCGFQALLHEALQRRQVHASVNGIPVRPHSRHICDGADYASFHWGPIPRNRFEVPLGWSPYAPAQLPVEGNVAISDADRSSLVVAHRLDGPPLAAELSGHLTTAQMAGHFGAIAGISHPVQLVWPSVAPLCSGAPLHCVLLAADHPVDSTIAIIDCRRVLSPPAAPFCTVEVASLLNFQALVQGMQQIGLRHRPVTAAYLDESLLGVSYRICKRACVITLLSHWQTRGNLGIEAVSLLDNIGEAGHRPGLFVQAAEIWATTWRSLSSLAAPLLQTSTTTSTPAAPTSSATFASAECGERSRAAASTAMPVPAGPPVSFRPFEPPEPVVNADAARARYPPASKVFRPWSAWEEAEEQDCHDDPPCPSAQVQSLLYRLLMTPGKGSVSGSWTLS